MTQYLLYLRKHHHSIPYLLIALLCILLSPGLSFSESSGIPGEKILTLKGVIGKVLKNNPELAAFKWEIQSREAVKEQESLRPNPEVEVELENFAGSGDVKGFKGAEYSLRIAQPFILGGKRSKAVRAAELDKKTSIKDYDVKVADLVKESKSRFIDTLLLQERLTLREKMLKLSVEFLEKIDIRVKAGKTLPAEKLQAEVDLFRNRMALQRLKQDFSTSKLRLASLWGSTSVRFTRLKGELKKKPHIAELTMLEKQVSGNANLGLLASNTRYMQALVLLEKSRKIPDAVVSGGIRRLNDAGGSAFTFSLSIPIPLFNRNQGAIKAAQYRLKKAEAEENAAKLDILNQLRVLYKKLEATGDSARMLKGSVLPKAVEAAESVLAGYRSGRFNYLNVMDAYRTQLEVKEEYLETMAQFWQLITEMDRLTLGVKIGVEK